MFFIHRDFIHLLIFFLSFEATRSICIFFLLAASSSLIQLKVSTKIIYPKHGRQGKKTPIRFLLTIKELHSSQRQIRLIENVNHYFL